MSVNRAIAAGAFWTVSMRVMNQSIGFVSTLILARLLVPADFGLVALATASYALLVAISDFSIHVPLIQKPEIDDADMNSAWSLQLIVGVSQAGILLISAGPLAAFYGDPRLVAILWVLAALATVRGARNVGIIMFQREMVFSRDFKLVLLQRLASFTTTIAIAAFYGSYWALVIGMLAGALAELMLSYGMHPYRPRWELSRAGELFRFSRWLMLNNLMDFVANRGPELLLGKLSGPRVVGLFSVSYEISMLPTTQLVAPINRAALPGYSRLRDAGEGMAGGYLDVLGMIALLSLPAAIGISAGAEVLIPVLLGDKWLDAVALVHNIAIAGAVSALMTNNRAILLAIGRPRATTALLAVRTVLFLPAITYGAQLAGAIGVSIALIAVELAMLVINTHVIMRAVACGLTDYLRAVLRPLLGASVMYGLLTHWVLPLAQSSLGGATLLCAAVVVASGAAIYLSVVALAWLISGMPASAERHILSEAGRLVSRLQPTVGS